ncbi:phospholipase D family protein [Streptomyces sp. NPDC127098]|uniref:phospholipase D family protein n=1 Tax=Streptomyces sp. NPDC127098 TaxID=3347137 RepID=UPI0036470F34
MANDHVWQQIEQLLQRASERVVLIAPFIKKEVFRAALAAIPHRVEEVQCITRWSVAEVAAGVSDPEIAEIAEADGRARILLCHNLHAKLYIVDGRCLVGSANLTGRATGRVPDANIELLLETEASHPEIQRTLDAIGLTSVPASVDLARQIREQADLLRADEDAPRVLVAGHGPTGARWLPETRNPERLYRVYNGRYRNIGTDVLAGVLRDLAHLDIPPGLSEQAFGEAVLAGLRTMPEIRRLFDVGALNMDDAKGELVTGGTCTEEQAQRAVETIAQWLNYFDEVHLVPVGPWEIRQGREIT